MVPLLVVSAFLSSLISITTLSSLFLSFSAAVLLSGDVPVKFSVSAPEGHWLIFDENGKGGTYNAPQFIKAGDTTSDADLLPMVRNGYTFKGWYTGAPSSEGGDPTGEEFVFGGELNQNMSVNVRGTGTIGDGSTASPLILIDGIEGDMNTINYNDVESISVLKDAASASIYGARGAFGVILITTKSGNRSSMRKRFAGSMISSPG